jgi:hypothetical protein
MFFVFTVPMLGGAMTAITAHAIFSPELCSRAVGFVTPLQIDTMAIQTTVRGCFE